MNWQLLKHAAELLDAEARGLRMAHTPDGNGDWDGEPEAKAAHDDMHNTANALRAMAETQNQSPPERKRKC